MARCEDCIHYKVCDDWAKSVNDEYCACVELHPCDNFISTADVVPKSEYDLLKKSFYELTREARGYLNRIYGIRANVAREIFEEIESLLAIYTYEDNYGEYISTGLADEFAELKKKYTEEKK